MSEDKSVEFAELWHKVNAATNGLTENEKDLLLACLKIAWASIVEKESALPEEGPLIASVYLNRINRKMLLGADPTVIYALKLANRWDGNIHKADLQIDSPYNTYRFRGLPPGPIANPGGDALRAIGDPSKHDKIFFVATGEGRHVFSATLQEHERNVERYQLHRNKKT